MMLVLNPGPLSRIVSNDFELFDTLSATVARSRFKAFFRSRISLSLSIYMNAPGNQRLNRVSSHEREKSSIRSRPASSIPLAVSSAPIGYHGP